MSDFVAEYLSVFYYLKNEVLLGFIEQESSIPTTYDSTSGDYVAQSVMDPEPAGTHRGWVYYDESNGSPVYTSEQSSRVTVYRQGGAPIPLNEYSVNYTTGGITYSGAAGPSNIPQTADYYWNYVAVLDHRPGHEMPQLPVVALDILETSKEGYQLGPGKKNIRLATIDIFASSAIELRELTEAIYNGFYLKRVLCYAYNNKNYGHPLNYDGTFNSNHLGVPTVSGYSSCLFFDNVKASRVGLPVVEPDLNRFRSRVTMSVVSYEEPV